MLSTIIFPVGVIFSLILIFLKWRYTYWKRKGVPFLQPRVPIGNLKSPYTSFLTNADEYKLFYDEIKSKDLKHAGIYLVSTPAYIPIDLEIIKNILTRDFRYFDGRGRYYNEKDDPVSAHLFHIHGAPWRSLRAQFTPTFSPAKMKGMFHNLVECGSALEEIVLTCYQKQEPLQMKDTAKKFTSEIIGLTVFGVRFNALKNANPEMLVHTEKLVKVGLLETLRAMFTFSFPELSKLLKIPRYGNSATYFCKFITDLVYQRESKSIRRNDFLQLLIDLKNDTTIKSNKDLSTSLTMNQLLAQAAIFYIAGHETSAMTIMFALFEIANNFDCQEKLKNEIRIVKQECKNQITYDHLCGMKYLEQVVYETLRKYPPLAILNRKSNSAYKIPDSNITLDSGTPVVIPILGLHYDPEYFPNPDIFDPDRFSAENIVNIKPYSYLPFGEGPKNCIGLRFGMLQTMMALYTILKDYQVSVNPKTKIPIKFTKGPVRNVVDEIWLDVQKIT